MRFFPDVLGFYTGKTEVFNTEHLRLCSFQIQNLFCFDVFIKNSLNGSIILQLLKRFVQCCSQCRVVFGYSCCIILCGVCSIKDLQSLVSLYKCFCRLLVDNYTVNLALKQCLYSSIRIP